MNDDNNVYNGLHIILREDFSPHTIRPRIIVHSPIHNFTTETTRYDWYVDGYYVSKDVYEKIRNEWERKTQNEL